MLKKFKKIVFTSILLIFSSSIANAEDIPFLIEGISTPFSRGTTVIIGNQNVGGDPLIVSNINNLESFTISTGVGTRSTVISNFTPNNGSWQLEVPVNLADGTYSVTWDSYIDGGIGMLYNTTFTFSIGVPIATVTSGTGVVEPIILSSVADTIGDAVNLFDFTISDGVVADKKSTDVTDIVIHTSGTGDFSKVTWRLNGADASNVVGVYSANDNTITFSGLSISVADITSETYTINGYFNDTSNLTDNSTYILSVDGDTDLTLDSAKTHMGATEVVDNGTGTRVVIPDTLPTASSVTLTGTVEVGQTLTGTYTYNDTDGDGESGTSFVWYRSDDTSGTNKRIVGTGISSTYTLTSVDTGKYMSLAVIPRNANGTGLAVESAINGSVVVVADTIPTITSTPITTATEGTPYSYTLTGNDVDGDDLTWSVKSGETLPSWLSLDTDVSVSDFGDTISKPTAMVMDSNDNMYVVQEAGTTLYKITPDGTTTEFATVGGNSKYGLLIVGSNLYISHYTDGKITKVDLNNPSAGEILWKDSLGQIFSIIEKDGYIYIAQTSKNKVSRINLSDDTISDFVPTVSTPVGLAFASNGDLYITTGLQKSLLKYDGRVLTTTLSFSNYVFDLKIDTKDNMYVGLYGGGVKKISPDLSTTDISNSGQVYGIVINSKGTLFWSIIDENKVVKLPTNSILSGTPTTAGDYAVNLTLSDGNTDVAHDFTITVNMSLATTAIAKIQDYAENGGTVPTVQDYANAGIVGVDADNLNTVNAGIDASDASGVDTLVKVQAIVSAGITTATTARTKITGYAIANTYTVPTLQDYVDAGVTGVTADNLNAVNAGVDASDADGVDTLVEIQAIANTGNNAEFDARRKIIAYATDGTIAPTVQDYLDAGVTGVTSSNLNAVNAGVDASNASGVDTLVKVQAIVITASTPPTPPVVIPPSSGGGSSSGGSTYTPTPEEPEEKKEEAEEKKEEEKVVVQPITKPIVVERTTGNAEQTGTKPQLDNVTRLYIATFGRAPRSSGSNYWLYKSKLNLEDIARSFFDQEETKDKYPEGFSNYDFIIAIYNHVYARDPDQAGGDYWLEELNSGKIEKGLFILAIINGAIGDDALMLSKQTIAGVGFVRSGVESLDMAKKVIDDMKL